MERKRKMTTKGRRNHDLTSPMGFTLLEVLMAMFLLTIGLLAVAKMQITAIQGNATAMRSTEKMAVAQNKIDELMAMGYTAAELDPDNGPYSEPDVPQGVQSIEWDVEADPAGATDDLEVTADLADGVANSKVITLTVTPDKGSPFIIRVVKSQVQDD